ncbi:HK97 family phage major capsid protein [Naumannella halotolerans]|uniref:HK97 family phage major capsid protein n=2 Tax=Naumannella halotolerans TaxID=993414 RepID=A0A4V3EN07_9ACTN|nr:HK97 family phage major capsid protein [Naumannella halotolerans]
MATETTVTSATAWSPDVSVFAASEVLPDALILRTATVAGSVEGDAPVVRVAWVDDADAEFTAEGAAIPESDPTLSETLIPTGKISQLLRLSREQWQQPGTSTELSASVQRAVTRRANEAYLTQAAPTAPAIGPAPGLLNVAGTVDGEPVDANLDALVDLVAQLEANNATPTHILIDPAGWAALRKFKTATGSAQTLLGAGTADAERRLLDLPVITSPAMPAKTGLVIDKAAVVAAAGPVRVAQSEHAYFDSDSVALRCTWRVGQNVVHPDRIGTFTVA